MSSQPWTLVGLHASVRFTLVAESCPGLLPRLLQPFAKRDLTPDRFEARSAGGTTRVDIAMQAMPAEMVHLVEGNLRSVVGVQSVTSSKEITGQVRHCAA
jgi:hypothetical protein